MPGSFLVSEVNHDTQTVEWLDLVNKEDEVVGRITREEAWTKRLPVRVINAFIINSDGKLWIPRRTAQKRMFPNCLDMSVGGHVESGEDYLWCFKRETQEELNLNVDDVTSCSLGRIASFLVQHG